MSVQALRDDPRSREHRAARKAALGDRVRFQQSMVPFIEAVVEHTYPTTQPQLKGTIIGLIGRDFPQAKIAQGLRLPDDDVLAIVDEMARTDTAYGLEIELRSWRRRAREMPYPEYLKTEHWHTVRARALREAKHRCRVCNNAGPRLEVHHRTYENLGQEEPADVIALCEPCHKRHHGAQRMAAA